MTAGKCMPGGQKHIAFTSLQYIRGLTGEDQHHNSIHLLQGAGACPSCRRARGRVHPRPTGAPQPRLPGL